MRLLDLWLLRFGPFTDVVLPFFGQPLLPAHASTKSRKTRQPTELERPERGGLHIVFGPNEAGKSTSLRAIAYLLYGFPHQTGDDQRHQPRDLRLGGRWESAHGVVEFVRRRGRKNTLFAADDHAEFDAATLESMMGPVDQERFLSQFSINYDQLVEGGREIVAGKGSVGELLFSAGAGIAGIHSLRQQLENELEQLFVPRGSTQKIAVQIKELERLKQERKEAILMPERWERLEQLLAQATAQKDALMKLRTAKQTELERKRNWLLAAPLAQRRITAIEKWQRYADVPRLPHDFAERRVQSLTKKQQLNERLHQLRTQAAAVAAELQACQVDGLFLSQVSNIEQLKDEWSVHAKAIRDSQELRRRQQLDRDRLQQLQRDLHTDVPFSAELTRLTSIQRQTINELIKQQDGLLIAAAEKSDRFQECQQEQDRLAKQLLQLPPEIETATLESLWNQAQSALAAWHAFSKRRQTLEKLRREWPKLCQLARVDKEGCAWRTWQIPSQEAMEKFAARWQAAESALTQAQQRQLQEQRAVDELKHQLQAKQLATRMPSEDELVTARTRRDQAWREILAFWESRRTLDQAGTVWESLLDTFAVNQAAADHLADRLFEYAEHVAAYRQLQIACQLGQQRLAEIAEQVTLAETQWFDCHSAWQQLWQKTEIAPGSPAEMLAWLRHFEKMVTAADEIDEIRHEAESLASEMQRQGTRLRERCIAVCGELGVAATVSGPATADEPLEAELALLLAQASEVQQKVEAHNQLRAQLAKQWQQTQDRLPSLQYQSERAQHAVATWHQDWRSALEAIGIAQTLSPLGAQEFLEACQQADQIHTAIQQHQKRLDDMETNLGDYAERLRQIYQAVDLPPPATADEAAVMQLARQARAVQTQANRQQELQQRLTEYQQQVAELEVAVAQIAAEIELLMRDAQVAHEDELVQVERRFLECAAIELEMNELEKQLVELAGGRPLATFLDELEHVEIATLSGDVQLLTDELADLQTQVDAIGETIGSHRNELKRFDGGAMAAELEQQIQQLVAGLCADAEQFAQLKIALAVLDRALQNYKSQNQGPVVKRASEIFSELTRQSFLGLRIEFVEDENVLVGVRPDDSTVQVEQMSEGTADQLYLALRLASLEIYFADHPPMPVVVDDVLINFDDERAVAALRALHRLSQQTQVIYFTHHEHLVELVQDQALDDVFLCQLPKPQWLPAASR